MDKKYKNIPSENTLQDKLFEIVLLETYLKETTRIAKLVRASCQKLIYVKSGNGSLHIDGHEFKLSDNSFYLVGKDQIHGLIGGVNLKGYLLRFENNFLPPAGLNSQNSVNSNLLNRIIKSSELNVPQPEVRHYESLLQHLNYEYSENEQVYAKRALLQYLLLTLLTKLERRIRHISEDKITLSTDHNTKVFHSFLILIDDYYKVEHTISFYADKLLIDKRKLTMISKKSSGRKPKEILNDRLVTEAKRLLLYTTDNSKEIAYILGFEDPAYFSRFFKVHTGLSPKKFKGMNL